MARNTKSLIDPQKEFDDWIELHNISNKEIDLSGMYLSDSKNDPRKWIFPEYTTIPPDGYLIVWADGDEGDRPGIHLNFKLSRNGETILLIDKDIYGNQVLDSVGFGKQKKNVAIGRYPDGRGDFRPVRMTPGKRNNM